MMVEAIPDQRKWKLCWIDEEISVVASGGSGSCLLEGGVTVTVSGGMEMDGGSPDALKLLPLALDGRSSSGTGILSSNFSSSKSDTSRKEKVQSGGNKPPRPHCSYFRRCISTALLATSSTPENGLEPPSSSEVEEPEISPVIRSGGWTDVGSRQNMEDAHVRIDNLGTNFSPSTVGESPSAFYGVFDGHGGQDAANFVRENLLRFILDNVNFPSAISEAIKHAYLETDYAFAEACLLDQELSSGTTALAVLILGRQLLVANAGDCRAVLCKRGKAIEMSKDHKAACSLERSRIEALGGFVDDGYLNGQLAVTRALGDWHLTGLKAHGSDSPLTAEPEVRQIILTEEDEFMIIGCDGLWDVFTSQNAVDFARRKLQQHNDPEICSKELVAEALRRETHDNLTVVTVCFHPDPPPHLGAAVAPVRRSISAEGLRCLQDILDDCL